MNYLKLFIIVFISITLFSCHFSRSLVYVTTDKIDSSLIVYAESNIVLHNASIINCPSGFIYQNDTLKAFGELTTLEQQRPEGLKFYRIHTDSIAAIKYYETKGRAGTAIGNILLVLSAPYLPASLICIANPKTCFGSCPTVYTFGNNDKTLEAELFSSSISRLMENGDIDILEEKPKGNNYKLLITNEAMETHYIDKFNVLAAYHSNSTRLIASTVGIVPVGLNLSPPESAFDAAGSDILPLVLGRDSSHYRSGQEKFNRIENGEIYDNIIVKYRPMPVKEKITMVVRSRNTLLSTTLLYDVVLGSQGPQAIDWYHRMSTDSAYAGLFQKLYHEFSGIKVYSLKAGKWNLIGRVGDGGPINWKEYAIPVAAYGDSGAITLKLEFVSDNFMIDYIAFDESDSSNETITYHKLTPIISSTNTNYENDETSRLVGLTDGDYFVTEPGDFLELSYKIPESTGNVATIIVESEGYYTEWIRGKWLKTPPNGYTFNLTDVRGTFRELVRSWNNNRQDLEEMFFNSRIPVRK